MSSVCASESQIEEKHSKCSSLVSRAMDRLRHALFPSLDALSWSATAFWGALGGVLKVTWAPCGRSWEALGALLGARDVLLHRFGRSWERTFEATSLQHRASQHQVPNLDALVTILG